jgi:DNA-binding transcriptional regulator YdaS (Cro superfamily)
VKRGVPIATVGHLYEVLGGPRAVAKLLGLSEARVYKMRQDGSIPVKHARVISRALPQRYEMPYRLFHEP